MYELFSKRRLYLKVASRRGVDILNEKKRTKLLKAIRLSPEMQDGQAKQFLQVVGGELQPCTPTHTTPTPGLQQPQS